MLLLSVALSFAAVHRHNKLQTLGGISMVIRVRILLTVWGGKAGKSSAATLRPSSVAGRSQCCKAACHLGISKYRGSLSHTPLKC